MNSTLQTLILRNILINDEYTRKVMPFIKSEYFEGTHSLIFACILEYFSKYNKRPDREILLSEIENSDTIRGNTLKDALSVMNDIIGYSEPNDTNIEWLLNETERWCLERSALIAIIESMDIINGKDDKLSISAIPSILTEALSISFDRNVGHDYIVDSDKRFEHYHKDETKIPFDIDLLNNITKGGLSNKTLNIVLAGTGVGKSLFMCHCAASYLVKNKNVLYITLEMSEERIAERIDANLLNLDMNELSTISKNSFDGKIKSLNDSTSGSLIIKEYPTASAHAGHFRSLLDELKSKRKFIPDVIIIDYLNICSSSRVSSGRGNNVNSYTLVKSIAEELRGMAVEFDVPILSATQTTRSGYGNMDIDLEHTSESFGLPATCDFMIAIMVNESLKELDQIKVKQLKNRYNDVSNNNVFVIGVDRPKMRLYNLEMSAQSDWEAQNMETSAVNSLNIIKANSQKIKRTFSNTN